jgi:hypothetical protein
MARYSPPTSSASSAAVSPFAESRRPEPRSTSGGFHSPKSRSPRGDPSSVTGTTGSPHRSDASTSGRPMVAEQNTNVGDEP